MQLGSDALLAFRQGVRDGFSIRKIRVDMEVLGYSLERFSDVDLIKLWRKCACELKEEG